MMDLSGYQPEVPSEGSDFEAFKYEGWATVEKAQISTYDGDGNDWYQSGDKQLEIEVTCMEDKPSKGQQTIGRKLWKRFNLDSTKADKNGKTPVMKAADQLFAVGLTFKDMDGLEKACEKFVGMDIHIKAWPIDFKDGRDKVQAWNIKGLKKTGESKPTQKVAF